MKDRIGIFIITFFISVLGLQSQKPDLRFEKLTDKSGRSLGYVSGIIQDKYGFMWIATRNGLFRYDGYGYKLFKNKQGDSTSLTVKNITNIYYDDQDIFWIKHFDRIVAFKDEKILKSYDFITNRFYDISTKTLKDKQGNYWIGPSKDGIYKFDLKSGKYEIFKKHEPQYSPSVLKEIDSLVRTKTIIAAITDVTNNQNIDKSFEIQKNTDVLIISVGEGDGKSNFDYGFISAGEKIIWSMNQDNAKYGGGALKNKIQIAIKRLPKGKYNLKYISDNSTAFGDWKKGDEPDKINFYGIKVIEISQSASEVLNHKINEKYSPVKSLLSNDIKELCVDKNGNLAVISTMGIDRFNHVKNTFDHYPIGFFKLFGDVAENSISVQCCLCDDNDIFWLGTSNGLLRFDLKKNLYEHFQNIAGSDTVLTSNFIISIYKDKSGKIWLGTDKGITIYDRDLEIFYKYSANNYNQLFSNTILQIFEDKASNIWVATNEGLNKLKKQRFEFYDLKAETYISHVYPEKKLNSDRYWFLSKDNIFSCFNRKNRSFNKYYIDKKLFSFNPDTKERIFAINDIYEDFQNSFWLAIDNGLYLFDSNKGKIIDSIEIPDIKVKEKDIKLNTQTTENWIFKIGSTDKDYLLLFTITGIYKFDKIHNKISDFISFDLNFNQLFEVDYNFIKFVLQDSKSNFWLRNSNGIYKLDIKTFKLIEIFPFSDIVKGTSACDGNIWEDKEGNIWFAVLPDLYKIPVNSKEQKIFHVEEAGDVGHSNIVEDATQVLWIYTDNGLFRFDKNNGKFRKYTVEDGLANNFINGLINDDRGNIWITSNKGLTRYDIENDAFDMVSLDFISQNFVGLSDVNRKKTGELMFFTDRGFYSFYPDSINKQIPDLVINKFLLSGEEFPLDSIIHLKKHIILNYDQNLFTLEFTSLDYSDPAKNTYAYKLEGLNKDWIKVDALNRKASFGGIPPGVYIFRLKGSNNDKVWNEGIAIKITITPPFWKTTWFIILEIIFGILLVFAFIKWRERNLQKEKRILEEKVVERTEEIERQKEEIKIQRDIATQQRDQIAAQKQSIMDSIHYASRIQTALLPPESIIKPIIPEHFILNKPRDIVSGDYYWITQKEGKAIVVVADCTGHGVPGAFMSMLGVAFLNEIVNKEETLHANHILDHLKAYVIKSLHQTGKENESKDGMDVAMCIIDLANMKLEFAGAYNPLYLIRGKELIELKADRMPIGIFYTEKEGFTNHTLEIVKGDTIYMFSDGYADQFGGKDGRKFMAKQMKELILKIQVEPMEKQKELLDNTIEDWKAFKNNRGNNYEQVDDILVVGIRI